MPPKPVEPKNLSNDKLLAAFLKGKPEKEIVDEVTARTRGVLPCEKDGTVNLNAAVKFMDRMKGLLEHNVDYPGDKYERWKLCSIPSILSRPTTKLVHEPWKGNVIFDGQDPSNGMSYPTDPEQFKLLCFVVKNLPRLMGTDFNPNNFELHEAVNEQIAPGGKPKANVRALMMEYQDASDDEKKEALKLSTTEYWEGKKKPVKIESRESPEDTSPSLRRTALEEQKELPKPPVSGVPTIYCVHHSRDRRYMEAIRVHLTPHINDGKLKFLVEEDIPAGSVRQQIIQEWTDKANIMLPLLTADFMASEDCNRLVRNRTRFGYRGIYIGVVCRPCNIKTELGISEKDGNLLPRRERTLSDDLDTLSFEVAKELLRSLKLI